MAKQLQIGGSTGIFRYRNLTILKAEILGHGSYGAVYKARCDQLMCAAKVLHPTIVDPNDPGSRRILQRFQQECDFLNHIRHPHIVQYLGVCIDPDSNLPVLLMELLDESLTKMLEHSQHPISYHIQVDLCHDVSLAVSYLHSNDIIHRDLSGNNVLIIAGRRAKVTDFGMSKIVHPNHQFTPFTTCPGTQSYMSPESLKEPSRYTEKLDVFSEGVIMIQVCTRQFPDPGPAMKEIEDPRSPVGSMQVPVPEPERRKKHIDLIAPNHPLLPIATECLEYREKDRPSAEELCQRLAALKENPEYNESSQQHQIPATREVIKTLEQERDELGRQVEEKDRQIAEKDQLITRKEQEIDTQKQEAALQSQHLTMQMDTKDRHIEQLQMQLQELRKKLGLRKAENPWVRFAVRRDGATETQLLYHKFQAILNKLTVQNFQTLAEQALELEIDSEEKLVGCIDKTFTMVVLDSRYSIAYANLCKVLSPTKVQKDGEQKTTNFQRELVNKCQREFENNRKGDEEAEKMLKAIEEAETPKAKKQLRDELELSQTLSRKRALGNIKFIGELFKLKMISELAAHECIVSLLRSASNEELLECFVQLITTTGRYIDSAKAKTRIDAYFIRIADIIKKGKIPARIKFMLQDVQELRENKWVRRTPRVVLYHQLPLMSIDQIHANAELEAAKEMEMVQKHMVMKPQGGAGGGSRRDSKQDDWSSKRDKHTDRDRGEREREKFDAKRIKGLLKRKESRPPQTTSVGLLKRKESGAPSLGPQNFHGAATASNTSSSNQENDKKASRNNFSRSERSKEDTEKAPRRSSSSGNKRSSYHSVTTLESQQDVVKLLTNKAPPSAAQGASSKSAVANSISTQPLAKVIENKFPSPPLQDALDEETLMRKTGTIMDKLVTNKDYQEAVECVKELKSPDMMNVFVSESINHTLEKSQEARQCAGELFGRLISERLLSEEKFVAGLNDVLEFAEDIEVDVPRIWQYLGGILSCVMATSVIPLSVLSGVPSQLIESGKASLLVAQTLVQCKARVKDEVAVALLWKQSQLQWTALGVNSEDLGEFLSRQKLEFLQESMSKSLSEAPYLAPLTEQIIATDTTNKDIHEWIQKKCADILGTPEFVHNLTTALFQAVVHGSGTSSIFSEEMFGKRVEIIKIYVKASNDLQMSVLCALEIAVTRLQHPPRLLNSMFNLLYDLEVVGEETFIQWRDKGTEQYGKANTVMSVKTFFEWVEAAETDSDRES